MNFKRFAGLCVIVPALSASFAAAADEGPKPAAPPAEEVDRRTVAQRLRDVIDPVKIDDAPAKTAFAWWSRSTGIPLVIDWAGLEKEGIDPEAKINLDLARVPAGRLLNLIMQMTTDTELIYEVTPWYVQVQTKAQANRKLVLKVYELGDLVHEPTPVGRPPRFDLGSALSNTSSGGGSGSGGSSGSLFGDSASSGERRETPTVDESSERIADAIRQSVAPELWAENGGPASIKVYRGRLVVNAPAYVHAQIGLAAPEPKVPTANPSYRENSGPRPPATDASRGVAAVQESRPSPVARKSD